MMAAAMASPYIISFAMTSSSGENVMGRLLRRRQRAVQSKLDGIIHLGTCGADDRRSLAVAQDAVADQPLPEQHDRVLRSPLFKFGFVSIHRHSFVLRKLRGQRWNGDDVTVRAQPVEPGLHQARALAGAGALGGPAHHFMDRDGISSV